MARFKKEDIVWLSGDAPELTLELVVVLEVAKEPLADGTGAQYVVARTKDSTKFTCGEGVGEPGAISAL